MITRRSMLRSAAVVSTVGATGCLGSLGSGFSAEEVDGITTVAPQIYEVELGPNEYATKEWTAETDMEYIALFNADEGNLTVMALTQDQFWDYEDGENFTGYWHVASEENVEPVGFSAEFDRGERFVLVADNTGATDDHTINGPTQGRIETRARRTL